VAALLDQPGCEGLESSPVSPAAPPAGLLLSAAVLEGQETPQPAAGPGPPDIRPGYLAHGLRPFAPGIGPKRQEALVGHHRRAAGDVVGHRAKRVSLEQVHRGQGAADAEDGLVLLQGLPQRPRQLAQDVFGAPADGFLLVALGIGEPDVFAKCNAVVWYGAGNSSVRVRQVGAVP